MGTVSTIKFTLACGAALCLSGCGNYETTLPTRYNYQPTISTEMRGGDALQVPLRHDPYSVAEDEYTKQKDPMLTKKNPMLGSSSKISDPMIPSDGDMMTRNTSNGTQRPTYGRYILQGDISGGEVEIDVNGSPIGTFSSHVDEEITHWCHNGENTVSFVHHPLPGGGPISAVHVDLFNREKPSSPLTFSYDTQSIVSDSANASTENMPMDGSGGITKPSIPQPSVDPNASSMSGDAAAFTDERMFTDDPKSYEPPPSAS